MQENLKNSFMIVNRTLMQSVLSDIFTFCIMAGLLSFNHYLLSGNIVIDLCFIFMAWTVIISIGSKKTKRFNTKEEAIKFLQEQ